MLTDNYFARRDISGFFPYVVFCNFVSVFVHRYFLLADDIPRCHAGDTACITRTAQVLLKARAKTGYPSLGFPVIEPFFVKHFDIGDGRDQRNINLKLKFRDVTISGLSDAKIEKTV